MLKQVRYFSKTLWLTSDNSCAAPDGDVAVETDSTGSHGTITLGKLPKRNVLRSCTEPLHKWWPPKSSRMITCILSQIRYRLQNARNLIRITVIGGSGVSSIHLVLI